MSTMQCKDKPPTSKNDRRRGRPAGKNRVPLSIEERRARNAQYERERRNETAEAMAQLAEAACCDPQIPNPELLATVINRLQREANRKSPESLEELRRINDNLEAQIADLQSRLESEDNLIESVSDTSSQSAADSESGSSSNRPAKYRKTAKENTVHGNGKQSIPSTQSSRGDSSSDSQDSGWSIHQLGKTLPSQEIMQPPSNKEQFVCDYATTGYKSKSQNTVHYASSDSVSSQRRQTTSENDFHSESSNHTEANSELADEQRELKMEFQLVPERRQIESEHCANNVSEVSYMDLFTDAEKGILERLGCSDFIKFEDHHDNGNQARISWPRDFDDYVSGF